MKNLSQPKSPLSKNFWYITTAIGCFVPFGIIFSIFCTIHDVKHNTEQNKSILHCATAALIFSLFMSGYILWLSFAGNMDTYALAWMYIPAFILAIYLYCVYFILARRAKFFNQCILLIQQEHITSIPQISEIVGLPHAKTISVLKKLIKMGELNGAGVDEVNSEVIFTKSIWAKQKFICKSCGANLIINYGHTLTCEFCNGALEIQNK